MEMTFLSAVCSDKGIQKQTNQDSICLKIAKTSIGQVLLAVVCDGVGGLHKGEVASANVVRAFDTWFMNDLAPLLQVFSIEEVKYQWKRIIQQQNHYIREYGKRNQMQLGTTLTALLMIDKQEALIAQVGDSRAYVIHRQLECLTSDQTWVNREVERGHMTKEEATQDARRNILLQCIGTSSIVEPAFVEHTPMKDAVYLLCSDGFYHKLQEQEIATSCSPVSFHQEEEMKNTLENLMKQNKERIETDNMSAILIKVT